MAPPTYSTHERRILEARNMIKEGQKSIRQLARELGVSERTIWKWRHKKEPYDQKSGTKVIRTSIES